MSGLMRKSATGALTATAVPGGEQGAGVGVVTCVFATMGVIDSDGDVTLPGFFGRQTASIQPAHDHTSVSLGKALVREEGMQALAELRFNLAVPMARWWFDAIMFDLANPPAIQEYSYSVAVLEGGSRFGDFNGKRVRFLQPRSGNRPGVEVWEVSPVLKGAGVATRTVAAAVPSIDEVSKSVLIQAHLRLIRSQVEQREAARR